MTNISLSQRINFSFLLIVSIIVLSGSVFYLRALSNEGYITEIEKYDVKGMQVARNMRTLLTDHWSELTQQLLTAPMDRNNNGSGVLADPGHLAALEQNIRQQYQQYFQTILLEEDRVLHTELRGSLNEYFARSSQTLNAVRTADTAAQPHLLAQQKTSWLACREGLDAMVRLNEQSFDLNVARLHSNITKNIYTAFAAIIIAVLIAVLCGYFLRRAIMTPIAAILQGMHTMGAGELTCQLQKHNNDEFGSIVTGFNEMAESLKTLVLQTQGSAVQLITSITELAATSKQQQATVTETAATTAEIGATSKQISATARELLQTVNEAADAAAQTAGLAQTSQHSVNSMDDVMQQLSGAAGMVAGKLALLSERATGINQVVVTIMKVADQTNLLSLNAAIEAEKAGEYGKGFTVVANEIRRLADQTAIATYDIEQMVREIQSAVAAGVMGIDKFSEEVRRGSGDMVRVSEQLSLIIEQVQDMAPKIQLVNEGMLHQSEGADQINLALSQLGEATSQTVESLAQTSGAIDNMSDVASKLRLGVNRFKV